MAKQKLRVRCPCCGQMTDLDRMAEVNTQPAEVQVFLQTMGGKNPIVQPEGEWKKGGRGKAPGKMVYEEITKEMTFEQLASIMEWFIFRAKTFLADASGFGMIPATPPQFPKVPTETTWL